MGALALEEELPALDPSSHDYVPKETGAVETSVA